MPAYKTIIMEMLQDQPELYEQLRSRKMLLPTMDAYAIDLKSLHEEMKDRLSQARPASDPTQLSSEALELAIDQFREHLPSESPMDDADPLSLDAAMNYLRHTQPA